MVFLGITLLAALFRITFLSTIEFKTDEAVALFLASRPLFGHLLPPGSTVSSFGILNPPLFIYILFPFTLISLDPKIISAIIGLINAVSVGFFYLFVKKYYDKKTALFGSILLALSPWAIIFSKKIWPQDLIIPIILIILFSMYKILIEKSKKYWTLYTFSHMIILQLYPPTVFFLFLLNTFLLFKKIKIEFNYALWGIFIGIGPLIPYLFWEWQNEFQTVRSILHSGERVSFQHHLSVFLRPFQLLNQGNFYQIFGDDLSLFVKEFPSMYNLKLLFYSEYVILIIGTFLFFWKYPHYRFLVYISLLLPVVYYLFRITPEMHYFIILTPLLFLFIGTFFSFSLKLHKSIRLISLIMFISFIGISISYNLAFFIFLGKHSHLQGSYGTIFAETERLTKSALMKYKDTKEYDEMLLAAYIPYGFLTGDKIVSRMIYDFKKTEKNIDILDERIRTSPEDARVYNELLAFYTLHPPTKDLLNTLQKKSNRIPSYYSIYRLSYQNYLRNNYRKIYQSANGFNFEYPEHWQILTEKKTLSISGDGYIFSFDSVTPPCTEPNFCSSVFSEFQNPQYVYSTVSVLHQKVQEVTCVDAKGIWCGTFYGPFKTNKTDIILTVKKSSQEVKNPPSLEKLTHIIFSTLKVN